MDLFNNLAMGFGVAFTFQNLAYAFIGCLLAFITAPNMVVLPRLFW